MGVLKKKKKYQPRRRLEERGIDVSTPRAGNGFNRNQTMVGSSSTNVTEQDSPRIKTHILATKRRRVFAILAVIFIIVAAIWILVSHFTATVKIVVSDTTITKTINSDSYADVVQEYLNKYPAQRITFLLDKNGLENYIVDKLPEVESIEQQQNTDIGATKFNLTMRRPVAGWNIDNKQYYVDANGVQFEQNYFTEPEVQIIDESGVSTASGSSTIASRRFLSFVGKTVSLTKENGYTVTQAILPTDTTRQLTIKLKENGYSVKLSIDRTVGEQIEDMVNAIKYLTAHGITPQYIDVRVSGKAFYK